MTLKFQELSDLIEQRQQIYSCLKGLICVHRPTGLMISNFLIQRTRFAPSALMRLLRVPGTVQRGSYWEDVDKSGLNDGGLCHTYSSALTDTPFGNIFRITILIQLSAPVSSARQGIGSRKRQVTACSCSAEGDRYIVISFVREPFTNGKPLSHPPLC